MLCSMKLKRGSCARCAMFSRCPVTKLSSPTTEWPAAINRSVRCDPRNPAAPVISTFMAASLAPPPERAIGEAERLHLRRIVEIAAVDQHRLLERRLDARKIREAIFVPVCYNNERISSVECFVVGL